MEPHHIHNNTLLSASLTLHSARTAPHASLSKFARPSPRCARAPPAASCDLSHARLLGTAPMPEAWLRPATWSASNPIEALLPLHKSILKRAASALWRRQHPMCSNSLQQAVCAHIAACAIYVAEANAIARCQKNMQLAPCSCKGRQTLPPRKVQRSSVPRHRTRQPAALRSARRRGAMPRVSVG